MDLLLPKEPLPLSKEIAKGVSRREAPDKIPEEEWRRLKEMTRFEEAAYLQGYQKIAGIDEVGRGPLAGPVVACACLVPRDLFIPGVDDSKKLSPLKRKVLFETLVSDNRIVYSLGLVESEEIDRLNIYQATIQAMLLAVEGLSARPDFLLVDGVTILHPEIRAEKIIGGDALSQSIAAASILAKETRDRIMLEYHHKYPVYGFNTNKGYPTKTHLDALKTHGPCPIHRRTFRGVRLETVS